MDDTRGDTTKSNIGRPAARPRLPAPAKITNQTMELLAAIHALQLFADQADPTAKSKASCITVYTDSQYTIKCVEVWAPRWQRNGWRTADGKRAVQNKALIVHLVALKEQCGAHFVHVRGHTEEPADRQSTRHSLWFGNNTADQLSFCLLSAYIY